MNKLKNKKSVAVLLLLLGLTDIVEAQMLDKSSLKEWYYGFASHEILASKYFYQHLVTAGDTVIMGKDCKIIKQADDYGNDFNANTFGYVNMGKDTFYLHREPDRLLWFNEEIGEFTTLHDYSAQVGDSWTIQVDSCSFDVVVDSIDVAFFGGNSHRVLYVHDSVYEPSYFPYYEGCIIEDIGHTKHFFPIEIYWLCHNEYLCGTPEPLGIRCVLEDGDELYHQGVVGCDSVYSISHVGMEEVVGFQDVLLYPNPTTDVLRIQFDKSPSEAFTYQIYDFQGVCCDSGIIKESNSILVEHLPNGFYLLKLSAYSLTKDYLLKFVKN